MRGRAGFGAVLPLFLLASAGMAAAQEFNQFIGFGDSTIDSGFYRVLPNPGGGVTYNGLWASAVANGAGKPTTSPGAMSSEALASDFALTAAPSNQGGTNYATSGAKNVDTNGPVNGGFTQAIPTVTQISNYLAATGGHANSNALYLISSGGNDITYAAAGGTGISGGYATPTAYVIGSADSLASAVAKLQAAGARYLVVRGQPYSFGDTTTQADRLLYTKTLWQTLAADGVNFVPSDYNAVRLAIAANPSSFGFQFIDTGHPACVPTQPNTVSSAWALLCSSNPAAPYSLVTPNAERTHLFADDQHLTTAGQKIVADYEYSLIVAPSMISMLAEAPIKTRATLVGAIQNQIPVSQKQHGPSGFDTWLSGDVSSLGITNYHGFPDDPATPVALTAGFDFKASTDWLFGIALSTGRQKDNFSLGFGNFTEHEFAASAYAAYLLGPLWFDAVATYGLIRDDINRAVPIGITVQGNAGKADGSNISLAGETGFNFHIGVFTHGPVAGMVGQQVRIDGFTESGSFTALAFAGQLRNSAVSELGYQVSADAGLFVPFAKLVWDHELVTTDRVVTAWLTTTAAPSYWMPAVEVGKDWADGTVGTRVRLNTNVVGLAAFTGEVAQKHVSAYGGEIGMNVTF